MQAPSRASRIVACVGLVVAGLALSPAHAEHVRCPAVKDVGISSMDNEQNESANRAERLKLKVLQEMALVGFDVSGLVGRQIKSAELYVYPVPDSGPKFAEGRITNLRWIVASTVSSPWVEGPRQGQGATYRQANPGQDPWAWSGGNLSDVINGNLNSLFSVHELTEAANGYWKVPVDARVVQAMVAGLSDGLLLMDGSSTHANNPHIFSREARGREPYLLVEVDGQDPDKPAAPQIVDVRPDLPHANLDAGAVVVRVKTPTDAIGFHVKVDGQPMEPWQVELPKNPGNIDRITLEDLPAGKEVTIAVAAVDAAGNVSDWAQDKGKVSDKVTVPDLPKFPFEPKPGEPRKAGDNLAVWAFPEIVEVDPVTAEPMFEKDNEGYRLANPVYSGDKGLVRLAAGRGEIVAFQLALEHQGQPVDAQVTVDVRGPSGQALGPQNIHLYRVWYVPGAQAPRPARPGRQQGRNRPNRRNAPTQPAAEPSSAQTQPVSVQWNPEYLVPITAGKIQVPMPDNKIPNQKLQAVYVDLVIPGNAEAGTYSGQVRVRTAAGQAILPLELVVYPVRIPAELNFNPELNTYSGPAQAGSKQFFDWHRLAHYNRCTLNRVPYSQNGQVHEDMVPKLTGSGANIRVADWSDYDNRIGPLLDGSAFKGLPRDGVPVKTFYLPIFENWPMRLEGHYEMGMPPRAQGRAQQADARKHQRRQEHQPRKVDERSVRIGHRAVKP